MDHERLINMLYIPHWSGDNSCINVLRLIILAFKKILAKKKNLYTHESLL